MASLSSIYHERHRLPPSALKLVEMVGIDGALKIMDVYGGVQKVYIPQQPEGTDIARKLGLELANALSKQLGGGGYMYNIPRCVSLLVDVRNCEIIECHKKGESPVKLAYEFNMTERWIRTIIARQTAPEAPTLPFPGLVAK